MKIYIFNVTVNSIIKAKSTGSVINHTQILPNGNYLNDGTMLYTAEIDVTNNEFIITNKRTGSREMVILEIHSVGSLELDKTEYDSITIF